MRFFISTTFVLAGLTSLIAGSALPDSEAKLVARQNFGPFVTNAPDRRVFVPGSDPMPPTEGNTNSGSPHGRVMYLCDDEQYGKCFDLYLHVDWSCVNMATVGLDNWVHSMQAVRSNVLCSLYKDPNCAPGSIGLTVRDSAWPTLPRTSPKLVDNFSSIQCRLV
ncbi:hypothetical protein BDV98DRAFT_585851 [Pterulicium gracile]|uniref:Beta/gamma crystallin 'Greek key' domain-containing protein n=1 Tax=Pterulicium gracile TaxID=1884261 RepID=A0A5C3Q7Z7_9AGAR|nr:hypothetical protein BDV98DRAFT_585851 [Pterula gracilis]